MITVETILMNLAQNYPDLWKLITAVAYVMGMAMILRAVHKLKVYGEARTMMSNNANISEPIMMFISGTFLIYTPTAFQTFMDSTFGYSQAQSILGYTDTQFQWAAGSIRALLGLVQIIGLIAFVRGLNLLSKLHQQQQQGSPMVKAMTHIFGGILAINILGTKDVFMATLGFGS